jgi:hypothetical protein
MGEVDEARLGGSKDCSAFPCPCFHLQDDCSLEDSDVLLCAPPCYLSGIVVYESKCHVRLSDGLLYQVDIVRYVEYRRQMRPLWPVL